MAWTDGFRLRHTHSHSYYDLTISWAMSDVTKLAREDTDSTFSFEATRMVGGAVHCVASVLKGPEFQARYIFVISPLQPRSPSPITVHRHLRGLESIDLEAICSARPRMNIISQPAGKEKQKVTS